MDALYTSDEAKAPLRDHGAPGVHPLQGSAHGANRADYAERHDNIEAIYKKLQEKRDTADVTEVLKELHRIVNEAIRAHGSRRRPGRRTYRSI